MTRMSDEQESERETIENILSSLGIVQVEMRMGRLRIEQALERFPATDRLLRPVAVYVAGWEHKLHTVAKTLKAYWEKRNQSHWE